MSTQAVGSRLTNDLDKSKQEINRIPENDDLVNKLLAKCPSKGVTFYFYGRMSCKTSDCLYTGAIHTTSSRGKKKKR